MVRVLTVLCLVVCAATDGKLKQGFVKIYKNDVCDFLESNLFAGSAVRFDNSACQSANLGQDSCLVCQLSLIHI